MGGFIYAFDGSMPAATKRRNQADFVKIFGPDVGQTRQSERGPGGKACTLWQYRSASKRLLYKPEQQTWSESLTGGYWTGFYNDEKPTEQELRRDVQLAGHLIELGNGEKWLIPVARFISGGSRLPQSLILGSNGELVTETLPEFAAFGCKVEKLWQDFENEMNQVEAEPLVDAKQRWQLAVEALRLNYFVGADEVNALRLLTTKNLNEIMAAILAVPSWVKMANDNQDAKKKEQLAESG